MLLTLLYLAGNGFVSILIWVVCLSLVFYLLWWLIGYIALPEPFAKVAKVLLALAAVIFLIYLLLGIAGSPFDFPRR